jgi:DNA-binding sugar fermentation-stimulating protein
VERERTLRHLRELKAEKRLGEMIPQFFVTMWRSVDMMRPDGWTDDEIESAVEKYYIGAQ